MNKSEKSIAGTPDRAERLRLRSSAAVVAGRFRLALERRSWAGSAGNWSGAGCGSSIDFQDHRPYLPGDDPRHIDWAAYARSGQYIMKLYREEVSPRIDILLDTSRSMSFMPHKRDRALELLYFCVESALSIGAAASILAVADDACRPLSLEEVIGGGEIAFSGCRGVPAVAVAPLHSGSMRILISDLLFDAPPAALLRPLASARGSIVILVPQAREEEHPDWQGNMELIDCETSGRHRVRVDAGVLRRYGEAYERHFSEWRDEARRHHARMACVPASAGMGLTGALDVEAVQNGVVEAWT